MQAGVLFVFFMFFSVFLSYFFDCCVIYYKRILLNF